MKSVFTLFLVGFWVISWSQTSQIEGKVQDEENIGLPSATVVLLQPTDSVMKYFAITDGQGGFVIKNVKPASYLLQVSFMGYRTYYQSVEVQSNPVQLGNITLELEQQLLDEVVISEDRVPIRINKDTIEYDAGAFQTQPNAAVEELLKRLPGVEVESDGNVKAQGKDVQQILVDGKEFFGKDPKIATKNLPADAIKNVQVYDKKSDLAEFTGVDDGVRDKTINLELKDSHKSGLFGNVTAGYGDQGRYLGKLNLNNFTKKTRLSYIGSLNNINQETFSIMDYFSLTGGLGGGFGGGRVRLEINTDDGAFPGGVQSGINTIYSSGLNLSHDFSKNTSLTASYFFNGTRNDLYQTVNEQQFLPTGNLFSDDLTDRLQKRYDHRVNLQFKSNIDSLQQIRLNTKVGFNDFNQNAESSSLNSNALGALLNSSTQNYLVDGNRTSWSIEGAYRRKLGKPGRFVALSGNVGQNDQDQQAFIDALNLYYSGGQESLSDTLNQEQNQRQKEINYQAQLNYTEPIGKNSLVEWTLQRGKDDRDIDQTVWDLLMIFPERLLNEDLSQAYQQAFTRTSTGLRWQYAHKKTRTSVGVKWQQSDLHGKNAEASALDKRFRNVLPYARYSYEFSSSTNLNLDYSTGIQEPSLQQLQPLVNNNDPLNIYIGNPDLQPEYRHNLSLHFFSFNQFSGINFFANVQSSYALHNIVNAKTIDTLFRQVLQPVNTDHAWQHIASFNFGAPLNFIKSRFNISANYVLDAYDNLLNDQLNSIASFNQSYRVRVDNRNKDKVDIGVGASIAWQQVENSIETGTTSQYNRKSLFVETSLNAIKNWIISQSFNYASYKGAAGAASQKLPLWDASISTFVWKKKLQFKFEVVDILNRNRGISQNVDLNSIQFIQYRSLGRYFMMSAIYSIKNFGPSPVQIKMERF